MPRPAKNASSSDLSLEQVLSFIRRLDESARSQVAQALAECEMDARFERLIQSLATKAPVEGISDAEIQAEVDAVRQARLHASC